MRRTTWWLAGFAAVFLALALGRAQGHAVSRSVRAAVSAGAQPIDWTPLLPPGPGREHVTALCSNCHTPGILVLQRRTTKMWRDFLLGMNAARRTPSELCACIGGPLDDTELALVTQYLSTAFNKDNPIDQLPLNVNTASAAALARLPGLTDADVQRLVARRLQRPFASKDDIARLLGATTFQSITHFIDVKDSPFRADGMLPM